MMQMQRRSISGIIESIGWHRTAPGHCWAISSHMVACTVPKSSANVIFLTTPPFDGLLVTSWGRLISKGICSSSLSVGICLVYRMRPATVANRSDGRWYSALWRVFGLTDNANSLERLLPEIASVVVDDLPPQTTHVAKWRHYILACFLITVDDLILNDAFVAPCVMFFFATGSEKADLRIGTRSLHDEKEWSCLTSLQRNRTSAREIWSCWLRVTTERPVSIFTFPSETNSLGWEERSPTLYACCPADAAALDKDLHLQWKSFFGTTYSMLLHRYHCMHFLSHDENLVSESGILQSVVIKSSFFFLAWW